MTEKQSFQKISGLGSLMVALLLLIGCTSDNKTENAGSNIPETLRPLYEEVLQIHDDVMPEMSTLSKLQDQLSRKLDTLRAQTPPDRDALREANRVLGELNKAENAMWSWMHGFASLDSVPDHDKEIFLQREKLDALSMKDLMLTGIENAKEYLDENPISGSSQ